MIFRPRKGAPQMKPVLSICLALAASTAWAQTPPPPADQGGVTATAPPPIEEKPIEPPQAAAPEPGQPQAEAPTPERFQQVLSPHGRWVETPQYGRVWVPNTA